VQHFVVPSVALEKSLFLISESDVKSHDSKWLVTSGLFKLGRNLCISDTIETSSDPELIGRSLLAPLF
jgi:hypothetical protein